VSSLLAEKYANKNNQEISSFWYNVKIAGVILEILEVRN
jgi:hypothetical protein